MTGIQYLKDSEGKKAFLVIDYKKYGQVFEEFLENWKDQKAFDESMKDNAETFSFEDIRQMGIDKGIPDDKLAK